MPKRKKKPRKPQRTPNQRPRPQMPAESLSESQQALAISNTLFGTLEPVAERQPGDGLEMTVATGFAGGLSLAPEARMVGAALLYADHVTLLSPKASLLTSMDRLRSGEPQAVLELLIALPLGVAGVTQEHKDMAARWDQLGLLQSPAMLALLPPAERRELERTLAEAEVGLHAAAAEMAEVAEDIAASSGTDDVMAAVSQGLLTLDRLEQRTTDEPYLEAVASIIAAEGMAPDDSDTGRMVALFAARAMRYLAEGRSLPVFDHETSALLRSADLSWIRPAGMARARQGGLASGLIQSLPAFPAATVSEILDIRQRLAGPLIRFRSATLGLSREMAVEAFSEDFAVHVDEVWTAEVQPELLAIQEAIKDDSYLRELVDVVSGNKLAPLGGAGISAFLGTNGHTAYAVASALVVAGATAIQTGLAHVRHEEAQEQRQFWFLYEANRLMEQ
jgi:hypothetical protein